MKFKVRYTKDNEQGEPIQHEYPEIVEAYDSLCAKEYVHDEVGDCYNMSVRVV